MTVSGNNSTAETMTFKAMDNYTENGMDVASIVDGLYNVVLKTDNGTVVKRIMKVNQ